VQGRTVSEVTVTARSAPDDVQAALQAALADRALEKVTVVWLGRLLHERLVEVLEP
jgi:hypothetical protein